VKTSYFGYQFLKQSDNLVSIAGLTPAWFKSAFPNYRWYKPLVPPKQLVFDYKDGKISQEEYTEVYNKQLSDLDAVQVYLELQPSATLLCWEGPHKFCHRHLVADWLMSHLGIAVEEFELKL
jgi:uncharacterized protein YeaO (DUF488 family)